jgi:hypothetical protein
MSALTSAGGRPSLRLLEEAPQQSQIVGWDSVDGGAHETAPQSFSIAMAGGAAGWSPIVKRSATSFSKSGRGAGRSP